MKKIQKKQIALIATVLAFSSGCPPVGVAIPAPNEGIRPQVVNLFEEFVDLETSKLIKGKPKYGVDLRKIKSAFQPTFSSSMYANPNYGLSPYENISWFPTPKTSKDMTKECTMSDGWTVTCKVDFHSSIPSVEGSDSTATCSLKARFANKKGPLKTPNSLEALYDQVTGLPLFVIKDCQPDWLLDENDNYYDRPIDSGFKILFIERPEKVTADVASISKALMTIGNCQNPDFQVKKVISQGSGFYHVVTKHVDDAPAARGEFYSSFTLVKEPKYDNYYIKQDGYGWEDYFKCPMVGDYGQSIHGSGSSINENLG